IDRNDPFVEWVVVRPDNLVDRPEVSRYVVHRSPTRSAIFDAGVTSRANVAQFMADLMTGDALWRQWRYRMPVIYDGETPPAGG
ncbi:MAG: NAD(P)-dependent oxidoreductase, partial [Proteobacteria bacterium]